MLIYVKFYDHDPIPMEMHKVKIVQKLNLLPVRDRLARMEEAGFNTFQLHNGDIFMDMLTDSGVNAMSDNQLAAMMTPDDAYAGSESFYRMVDKLEACIEKEGAENVVFMRLESGTNLIGGQPVSVQNFKDACAIARKHGIISVLDASLLQDNLYFNKVREEACKDMSIREITREIADQFDIIYFSARKFGFARGGAILVRDDELFHSMEDLVPMFEGFLTYGGMSVREIEAMTVGFDESMDMDIISQGPQFIKYCVDRLAEYGVPMITPGGGLGAHVNASEFVSHIPQEEYPAGALTCAFYICGGIRGMERGTLSEERNPDGSERLASMELVRLAMPRRVFTLSQVEYVIDRVKWLYDHRDLIGGLKFVHEPKTLRFFTGRLVPTSDWPEKLTAAFAADFGENQ